jgi:hypothetical protein
LHLSQPSIYVKPPRASAAHRSHWRSQGARLTGGPSRRSAGPRWYGLPPTRRPLSSRRCASHPDRTAARRLTQTGQQLAEWPSADRRGAAHAVPARAASNNQSERASSRETRLLRDCPAAAWRKRELGTKPGGSARTALCPPWSGPPLALASHSKDTHCTSSAANVRTRADCVQCRGRAAQWRRRSQPKARFAGHGSRTHRGRSSSVGSAATRCTRGNRCTRMRRALVRAARASAVGQPICMTSPRHAHMDLKFPRLSNFRNIENLGSRAAPGRNEGQTNSGVLRWGNPRIPGCVFPCFPPFMSSLPFQTLEGQPTNLPTQAKVGPRALAKGFCRPSRSACARSDCDRCLCCRIYGPKGALHRVSSSVMSDDEQEMDIFDDNQSDEEISKPRLRYPRDRVL